MTEFFRIWGNLKSKGNFAYANKEIGGSYEIMIIYREREQLEQKLIFFYVYMPFATLVTKSQSFKINDLLCDFSHNTPPYISYYI